MIDKAAAAQTQQRPLIILSFVLIVVSLGYGVVIPVFPFYIEALGGSGSAMGLLIALAALTELLFSPIWGAMSDRLGRKRVLLIGVLGYGLSMLWMGLAHTLGMLIAARALSGMLTAATMPTAMAYVSDATSDKDRGGGIGALSSAAGLGVILGPGLGGWLGAVSLSLPFFIGAGLAGLGLLLVLIFLPESATSAPLCSQSAPRANDTLPENTRHKAFHRLLNAAAGPAGFALLLLFIASLGLANFEAVFGLYAANKYGYGPGRVGTILVVIGAVTTLGKGLLTGPLTRQFGETSVIKGSMATGAAGYLILLAAFDYLTVLLATGVFILSKTVLRPALLALISKKAEQGQGIAMGLGNTAISLARVIGPLWAGFAFDLNLNVPYITGAVTLFLGFLASLACRYMKTDDIPLG